MKYLRWGITLVTLKAFVRQVNRKMHLLVTPESRKPAIYEIVPHLGQLFGNHQGLPFRDCLAFLYFSYIQEVGAYVSVFAN
jgi:hypothetical protein